ncbi:ATP-dependent Clp protease proteolytic subunit [Natronospira sp.]|uniref:ATP-dependent Clp protease proteolytic subunit n=1 Tax=Natronospira sp. TaxID=2024970 RepID=UPI0038731171
MTTAYVSYYDVINEQKAKSLMQASSEILAQTKASKMHFLFSSQGGSVDAGVVLYNFFRALPVPMVMHNIGSIDSIANVIFLAADERYANANSTFLYHGINWNFSKGSSLSWTQLQETVSRFKGDEGKIIDIISQRTALTAEELKALFHQGETKGAAFAEEKGIIQSVEDIKVPAGAPFFALNFA